MFRRKITSSLEAWKSRRVERCLVVKGLKGVGKTSTIIRFLEDNYDDWVRVDLTDKDLMDSIFLDDPSLDELYGRIAAIFPDRKLEPGKTVLFLDGVHSCHSARDMLDAMAKDGRFYLIVGCSMFNGGCTNPAVVPSMFKTVIVMHPMDFEEFLWAKDITSEEIGEVCKNIERKEPFEPETLEKFESAFRDYCVVGGMPAAVQAYLDNGVTGAYDVQSKMQEVLEEYIRAWAPESERDRTLACFDSIPEQLKLEKKKFMFSKIEGDFAPIYKTFENSIDWLEAIGFAHRSYNLTEPEVPLDRRVRSNNFKIYMADPGLATHLMGEDTFKAMDSGDMSVDNVASTENTIANCISASGYSLYFFTENSLNVDFIIQFGKTAAAVEVKAPNNPHSKSLQSVMKKYGVERGIKFEDTNIHVKNSIEHYPYFASAFFDSMSEGDTGLMKIGIRNILLDMGTGQGQKCPSGRRHHPRARPTGPTPDVGRGFDARSHRPVQGMGGRGSPRGVVS